jgi:hypothetical protein
MSDTDTEAKTFTVPNMLNKFTDEHNYPKRTAEADMYLSVMQLKDMATVAIPRPSSIV